MYIFLTFSSKKKGVIKQVDTDITEDELKNLIKSEYGQNIKIEYVKRMFRRDESKQLIPTGTIIVTFRGQMIPKKVIIERLRYEVEMYILKVI